MDHQRGGDSVSAGSHSRLYDYCTMWHNTPFDSFCIAIEERTQYSEVTSGPMHQFRKL
jgi:hypothetical protein